MHVADAESDQSQRARDAAAGQRTIDLILARQPANELRGIGLQLRKYMRLVDVDNSQINRAAADRTRYSKCSKWASLAREGTRTGDRTGRVDE